MTVEIDYSTDETVVQAPITGAVEGEYSLNSAHVDEAISHLIEYFRNGPRNQAMLAALMGQVQELENEFWEMKLAFNVDTAVGDQLEMIGGLVGEGRQDRTDDNYRRAIRVRILVNKSDGKPEQLIEILDLIEPAAVIQLRELYPAALSIEADTLGSTTLQQAYRLMKAAKPAGVRLNLIVGAAQTVGAVDGTPSGGLVGAVDGAPAGAIVYSGT